MGKLLALSTGGHAYPANINGTEQWNGTSWVTGANMATSRFHHLASGTTTTGLVSHGDDDVNSTPYGVATSEEFTGETSAQVAKTIQSS